MKGGDGGEEGGKRREGAGGRVGGRKTEWKVLEKDEKGDVQVRTGSYKTWSRKSEGKCGEEGWNGKIEGRMKEEQGGMDDVDDNG